MPHRNPGGVLDSEVPIAQGLGEDTAYNPGVGGGVVLLSLSLPPGSPLTAGKRIRSEILRSQPLPGLGEAEQSRHLLAAEQ